MEILIEVERFFLIFVTAISIGGFLFTLRHRGYYSVWARSSILMGAISSFFLTFTCNFDVVWIMVVVGDKIVLAVVPCGGGGGGKELDCCRIINVF